MAFNLISVEISGTTYTLPSPVEVIPSNKQTIEDYLNGLNLGNFVVTITDSLFIIGSIQNPNAVDSIIIDSQEEPILFEASNCLSLEVDPEVVCDYTIQAPSDPSDMFTGIVINAVFYAVNPPILAPDQSAVQTWLNDQGFGFITYNHQGSLYIVATLSGSNLSYIQLLRNPESGEEVVILPFVQTNCHIPVIGCMNSLADNYNPEAEIPDNSCVFGTKVYGCTDPKALNYNPNAEILDDSCLYDVPLLLKLKCCAADMAAKIAVAMNLGTKQSCCALKKLQYINGVIDILENYHPDDENFGNVVTPGTPGSVTHEYEDGELNQSLGFEVYSDTTLIAAVADALYATENDFFNAVVLAVNASSSHTATNADETLTVTQVVPDSSALVIRFVLKKAGTTLGEFEIEIEGAVNSTTSFERIRQDNNCLTTAQVQLLIDNALEMCSHCCGDTDKQAVSDLTIL